MTLTWRHQAREVGLFLGVGLFSGAAYLLFTLVLTALGTPPTAAAALSFGMLVPPGYVAQRKLTFRSGAPFAKSTRRYVATQAISWLVVIAVTHIVAVLCQLPPVVAFLAAAASAAIVSFTLQKTWVF